MFFTHHTLPGAVAQRSALPPSSERPVMPTEPIRVSGKFFCAGQTKWYLKGLTYGPFEPHGDEHYLPSRPQRIADLRQIASLGANAIRLYHVPSLDFMDEAWQCGLRVLIDVPWEKHRCFLEDWESQANALKQVRATVATFGGHPATFAVSVANEIPKDVIRFYGCRRVEQFVSQLLNEAKQENSDCLLTYSNYPSTEFFCPQPVDFLTFNVYLEQVTALGGYLDRLQHAAGSMPLILGEIGLDSCRHGELAQAQHLGEMVAEVYRRGLAGAFVFSFTDDWFTGGHAVENWAFGVSARDRTEKPAGEALNRVWSIAPRVDDAPLPRVSVVVCSYNGAATLHECLTSLIRLDYPDYEVILVDDGSEDHTEEIAEAFPQVRYIRQENQGLSAARNVGAREASGQIVAYTDSDCIADDKWLLSLVQAMRDQKLDAIGGPNLPPANDKWVARCVAASPGGPSHVMLDDRLAEHVPGCNMAFDRARLLELGGFDPQFRTAGDDVDICWRFLDRGLRIGYAPAALVWHHRRSTVSAYLKQQKGYGRAEALLHFKHPVRFNCAGRAKWKGIIYGEGAMGLPLRPFATYHGRFGTAPFQIVYRHNEYSIWGWCTLLEWHAAAAAVLVGGWAWRPLLFAPALMWTLTLIAGLRWSMRAPLAKGSPRWASPLVFFLYILQPVARAASRYRLRLSRKIAPLLPDPGPQLQSFVKRITPFTRDLYWRTRHGLGREQLLQATVERAHSLNWPGVFDEEWKSYDVRLAGDLWHEVQLRTATEELGGPKRFTRVRYSVRATGLFWSASAGLGLWTAAALAGGRTWAMIAALVAWIALLVTTWRSARRCLRAVSTLIWNVGNELGMEPVRVRPLRRAPKEIHEQVEQPEPAGIA